MSINEQFEALMIKRKEDADVFFDALSRGDKEMVDKYSIIMQENADKWLELEALMNK